MNARDARKQCARGLDITPPKSPPRASWVCERQNTYTNLKVKEPLTSVLFDLRREPHRDVAASCKITNGHEANSQAPE